MIAVTLGLLVAPGAARAFVLVPGPGAPTRAGASAVAIADVTGDGRADVVAPELTVIPGDGSGRLGRPVRTASLRDLENGSVVVADMDGDGRAELISAGEHGPLVVLAASASGRLTVRSRPGPVPGPQIEDLAVADVNGDGLRDIVVRALGPVIAVFLSEGAGRYRRLADLTDVPFVGNAIVPADLNRDGRDDLVTSARCSGAAAALLGSPTGALTPVMSQACGVLEGGDSGQAVATGDLNGDGLPDAVVSSGSDGARRTFGLLGDGTGNLRAAPGAPVAPGGPIAVADFDGDGRSDVAVANPTWGDVVTATSAPDGGLHPTAGTTFDAGLEAIPLAIAAGDLNGDGRPDIVAGADDAVRVLLNVDGAPGPVPPRGTARMTGTRGCVRSGRIRFAVSGRQISSVEFGLARDYGRGSDITPVLPGPLSRYVTTPDAGGAYSASQRARLVPRGRYVERATVSFRSPAHTRTVTLQRRFRRC